MTTRAVGSILSLAMAAALVAPAAEADQGRRAHKHDPMVRMQAHLGLSPEQAEAVREIHDRNREAAKRIGEALRENRQELRQLALQGADSIAVEAKAAQVEQLLGEFVRLRVKTLQEMAPLLTEEQRQKLEQHRPHMHGRRGDRS